MATPPPTAAPGPPAADRAAGVNPPAARIHRAAGEYRVTGTNLAAEAVQAASASPRSPARKTRGHQGGTGAGDCSRPAGAGNSWSVSSRWPSSTATTATDQPADQPSDKLRHLIEIRDGECTYPPCRRAARRCDFEHAIPWDQGGWTCACNAGPRCRHHHHAKQAYGWSVEQNLPGYHTWTTPAGRIYTTGPTQ